MDFPQIGPKKTVYEDDYQQLYKVSADFGEFSKEYVVRDSGKRAGMVAVRNKQILLVRQYRLLINDLSWEIPGGKVEVDETPSQAAVRECKEEAGILCDNLKPLINFHLGLDTLLNPTFVFYSNEVTQITGNHVNPREVVQQQWISGERCLEMINEGTIQDSLTIIALLSYTNLDRN
jgi:8-oxo-dGTP pyrophosphatase MutT (NUDIX family)